MPDINTNIQGYDEDAVLKEVWSTDGIEAKTELDLHQIEQVNKLKTLSKILQNEILNEHVDTFMILMKSKNRQSMKEFTDVVRAKREDFVQKGSGFFKGMMG